MTPVQEKFAGFWKYNVFGFNMKLVLLKDPCLKNSVIEEIGIAIKYLEVSCFLRLDAKLA
jgi:hypothetical protein